MKEQKYVKKILYVVIAIVIITGAVICGTKGFNIELLYSNRKQIAISDNTELDMSKIKEITKSILENRKVEFQKVERFGNAIQIIATEISEEDKENIINKMNEEMSLDISKDDVDIVSIANTRIRDILKPYIIPGVISFVIILVYFVIIYNKIGLKKILLNSILVPIITELTFYSIIAITRFPFGRITNALAIGLYLVSIGYLTIYYQREKEQLTKKEERKND